MKRIGLAISATLVATALAWAGPVEDREALMKERGGLVGQLSKIAKGEVPFEAAGALEVLKQLQANADNASTNLVALWGPGTEGGEASPAVYSDAAGFKAATDKFKADVDAAVAAAPADVAAFQAAFGSVAQNCGACHEIYRVKK